MSYTTRRGGGMRVGSAPQRETETDTSGTAPDTGPSVLQTTANPKTIILDCNRANAEITKAGGNPENHRWTCSFPPVEIKAGDEIRVNQAMISSVGVGDLIEFDDTNKKAGWVMSYYVNNDGLNSKREGYNMIRIMDRGVAPNGGGLGNGEAAVWGGDGIWAYPHTNQAAELFKNYTRIAYMIPPVITANARHNLKNPWCPLAFRSRADATTTVASMTDPADRGPEEAATRWYEDPYMAGRYLSNVLTFNAHTICDVIGAGYPAQNTIQDGSAHLPYCYRFRPYPFSVGADINTWTGNPVMLMQIGEVDQAAGLGGQNAVQTNADNWALIPAGFSFTIRPQEHSYLPLQSPGAGLPGAYSEDRPTRAGAKEISDVYAYKLTCVGHWTDNSAGPYAGKSYTIVERPYQWLPFATAVPSISDVGPWGTGYFKLSEGSIATADPSGGSGGGGAFNAHYARAATVNTPEQYDLTTYETNLSPIYYGPTPVQQNKNNGPLVGTPLEQAVSSLNPALIPSAVVPANPTNTFSTATNVSVKFRDGANRVGSCAFPIVAVSLSGPPIGGGAVSRNNIIVDIAPTFSGQRAPTSSAELIAANANTFNFSFYINLTDANRATEVITCYAGFNDPFALLGPPPRGVAATLNVAHLGAGNNYTLPNGTVVQTQQFQFDNCLRQTDIPNFWDAAGQATAPDLDRLFPSPQGLGSVSTANMMYLNGADLFYQIEMPAYSPCTVSSTRMNHRMPAPLNGEMNSFSLLKSYYDPTLFDPATSTPDATVGMVGLNNTLGGIINPTDNGLGTAFIPLGLPASIAPSNSGTVGLSSLVEEAGLTVPIKHYRRHQFEITDSYASPSDIATELTKSTHNVLDATDEWGDVIPNTAGKGVPQNNFVFPVWTSFAQSSEPAFRATDAGQAPMGWNPSERGTQFIAPRGKETHGSYKLRQYEYKLPPNRFVPAGDPPIYVTEGNYWIYFRTKYLSINKPRVTQGSSTDFPAPVYIIEPSTGFIETGNAAATPSATVGLSLNRDFNVCGQSNIQQTVVIAPDAEGTYIGGPTLRYLGTTGGVVPAGLGPQGIPRAATWGRERIFDPAVAMYNPATPTVGPFGNNEAIGFPIRYINSSVSNAYVSQMVGASDATMGWSDDSSRFSWGNLGQPSTTTFDIASGSGGEKAVSLYLPVPTGQDNHQFHRQKTRIGGVNVDNWRSYVPAFGQTPAAIRAAYAIPNTYTLDVVSDTGLTDDLMGGPIATLNNEWFLDFAVNEDPVSKAFWAKLGYTDAQVGAGGSNVGFDRVMPADGGSGFYEPKGSTELLIDAADAILESDEPAVATPYYALSSIANNPPGTASPAQVKAGYAYSAIGAETFRNGNFGYGIGNTSGEPGEFRPNSNSFTSDKFDEASSTYNPDRNEFRSYTIAADTSLIEAAELPIKTEDAYFLIKSDLLASTDYYTSTDSGFASNIIATASKLNSGLDNYFSYQAPQSFFAKRDTVISSVTTEILTSSLTKPPAIAPFSSVIYSITRQNDEPIKTMDPLWERQEQAWQGMLDTFDSISQQVNPPKQSRADRVQEVINEIANAVTDPNADSALPERIIANFQALPAGVRGDRNQLRNYLLNNPDAGEFLRDVTAHINRRVPPAFAATVTDPEAVNPDALLVQALGVPVPVGHNIVAPEPEAFQHEMIPAVAPESAPDMPRDMQMELIARAAEAADDRDRQRFYAEVTSRDPSLPRGRSRGATMRFEQHVAAGYPTDGTPLEQQDYIRQYYAGGGTLPGDEAHVEAAPTGSSAAASREEEEEEEER